MSLYCPHCWAAVPEGAERCPVCGHCVAAEDEDYVEKLITALHHFEPTRAALAIQILGEMMGEPRAIIPLVELLDTAHDAHVLRSAAAALGHFADGGRERVSLAVPALSRRALDLTTPLVVRVASVEALARIGGNEARATLESALDDPSFSVRDRARQGLDREFGDQETRGATARE